MKKLPVFKVTAKYQEAMDDEALVLLSEWCEANRADLVPLFKLVQDYRRTGKIKSTYIDGYQQHMREVMPYQIFYDTGKEFQAIYNLRDKVKPLLERKGIKFTQLEPGQPFDYRMFEHRTKSGRAGYGWCGCRCRWGTTYKVAALDKYGRGAHVYVGIAADEHKRLQKSYGENKSFPLAEWGMTESDCLTNILIEWVY